MVIIGAILLSILMFITLYILMLLYENIRDYFSKDIISKVVRYNGKYYIVRIDNRYNIQRVSVGTFLDLKDLYEDIYIDYRKIRKDKNKYSDIVLEAMRLYIEENNLQYEHDELEKERIKNLDELDKEIKL